MTLNSDKSAVPVNLFAAKGASLSVGVIALLICIIACIFDPFHALRAYLFAWLACVGIALGSMSLLMLNWLTGGDWGYLIRRPAEAAALTLPILFLLFAPLVFGFHYIYPWANADQVREEIILQHRGVFFGRWLVLFRCILYFSIWTFLAWRLRQLSLASEQQSDPQLFLRLRRCSAGGFVVYFVTMSLAAIDWIASREVDWSSSTFGLLVIIGQATIAISFLICILAVAVHRHPTDTPVTSAVIHDLGNLLLTMVVLWSYVEFAQFLVIWMGNSQEDNLWYYHRARRGWAIVGTLLILGHFALPFVMLLIQRIKRSLTSLGIVAAVILAMRVVHVLWMIAPSNSGPEPRGAHWLDPVAFIGVGGIWFACFLWILQHRPFVPLWNHSAGDLRVSDESGQAPIRPVT